MANPQAENGHTDIAHDVIEKLCLSPLSGSELRVCLFVLRKTWGWKKKADHISISQLQQGTGLNRKTIVETLSKLVTKRLLLVTKGQLATSINSYQFNKNYDDWLVTDRQLGSYQKTTRVVTKRPPKLVTKRPPTKEKKETITKEIDTNVSTASRKPNDTFALYVYVAEVQGVKPFPSKEPQLRASKSILQSGYTLEEAKQAVDRMYADDYWRDRTFDVIALARHITKYSVQQKNSKTITLKSGARFTPR